MEKPMQKVSLLSLKYPDSIFFSFLSWDRGGGHDMRDEGRYHLLVKAFKVTNWSGRVRFWKVNYYYRVFGIRCIKLNNFVH